MSEHSPTESTDPITVVVLEEGGGRNRIDCGSYEQAIDRTREEMSPKNAVKIESRDGEIMYSSRRMNLDEWEKHWRREKKRAFVEGDERECPYGNTACFDHDLCVQCKINKVQEGYEL
jgi:hypothetical protein